MMNHFFNLELLDQLSYGPAADHMTLKSLDGNMETLLSIWKPRFKLGNITLNLETSLKT